MTRGTNYWLQDACSIIVVAVWTGTALAHNNTHCNSNIALDVIASPSYNKIITSPNYPLSYDHDTDCLWVIQSDVLNNPDHIVKVVFNDFNLNYGQDISGANRCPWDYLNFYDGPSMHDKLLGTYCSTLRPDVIYSTGQYLYVKYHTTVLGASRGFNFSFSSVNKEEASTICRSPYLGADFIRLSGSSGTLFSPDFPVPYPRNAICIWTITVPAGKRVKLTFENFALLTSSSGCRQGENDYVEVRDTLHEYGRELGYYCDFNTPGVPADVYSSRRYMWVKFFSGSGGVFQRKYAKGFKARFEAVDKPGAKVANKLVIGLVIGVLTFVFILICVVCIVKRKGTPNRAAGGARIPMNTTTTSASHTTPTAPPPPLEVVYQAADNRYPPSAVGDTSDQINSPLPPPAYPYPLDSPPSYPGVERAPQYPPPGESYPWLQTSNNAPAQPPSPPGDS